MWPYNYYYFFKRSEKIFFKKKKKKEKREKKKNLKPTPWCPRGSRDYPQTNIGDGFSHPLAPWDSRATP